MTSVIWMHCNKCYNFKVKQYYLTECAHMLCHYCAQRSRDAKACPTCKSPVSKLMPLDRNTPSNVADHFKSDFTSQFVQMVDYQNKQFDDLLAYSLAKDNHNMKEFLQCKKGFDEERKKTERFTEELKSLQDEAAAYPAGPSRMMDESPMSHSSRHFSMMQPNMSHNARDIPIVHRSISSMMSEGSNDGDSPVRQPTRQVPGYLRKKRKN